MWVENRSPDSLLNAWVEPTIRQDDGLPIEFGTESDDPLWTVWSANSGHEYDFAPTQYFYDDSGSRLESWTYELSTTSEGFNYRGGYYELDLTLWGVYGHEVPDPVHEIWSESRWIKVSDFVRPETISEVKAEATGDVVTVSWRPSAADRDIEYYLVRRRAGHESLVYDKQFRVDVPDRDVITERFDRSAPYLIDDEVQPGIAYYYEVKAVDWDGKRSDYSAPTGPAMIGHEPDRGIPTASLDANSISVDAVAGTMTFDVIYSDDWAVDVSDLDSQDLRVTGPNGYDAQATFLGVDNATDGVQRTATYRVIAPGGQWDSSDEGRYVFNSQDSQVSDLSAPAKYVPNIWFGVFDVDFLPEIDVERNGMDDVHRCNFGEVTIGQSRSVTFTVRNEGLGDLRVERAHGLASPFSVTPANDSDSGDDWYIASNETRNFTVIYSPTDAGQHDDTLSLWSDDPDEREYEITLTGTGTAVAVPEIETRGNGLVIASGDSSPSEADGTDFGSVEIGTSSQAHEFTVWNVGAATLGLTGGDLVAITGSGAFSVKTQPSPQITAANSTTFEIVYLPIQEGGDAAVVSIANTDVDRDPYTFTIEGTGFVAPVPRIQVRGEGYPILNGDTEPDPADGTDFGSADVATGPVSQEFAIWNLGGAALELTGAELVSLTGSDAFSIVAAPDPTIAAAKFTTFEVQFAPASPGAHEAVITIANTDSDNGTYTFTIEGTGLTKPNQPVGLWPRHKSSRQSRIPTLVASAFSDADGGVEVGSWWQVASDETFQSMAWQKRYWDNAGNSGKVSWKNLEPSTIYYWRVCYKDSQGLWSDWSETKRFKTAPNRTPKRPQNVWPKHLSVGQKRTATLTASKFVDPDGDAHLRSKWQISADGRFTTIVFRKVDEETEKTSEAVPGGSLQPHTRYWSRVRYCDGLGAWSDWSTPHRFTTGGNKAPVKPNIISPSNRSIRVSRGPSLGASSFVDRDGDEHVRTWWQVSADGRFQDIVWREIDQEDELRNRTQMPKGVLGPSTRYWCRVRYRDALGKWSAWSDPATFKTKPNEGPEAPIIWGPRSWEDITSSTTTFGASGFYDPDGDNHKQTWWRVRNAYAFDDTIRWQKIDKDSDKTQEEAPVGTFGKGIYYLQVRYCDSLGRWGNWSGFKYFQTF